MVIPCDTVVKIEQINFSKKIPSRGTPRVPFWGRFGPLLGSILDPFGLLLDPFGFLLDPFRLFGTPLGTFLDPHGLPWHLFGLFWDPFRFLLCIFLIFLHFCMFFLGIFMFSGHVLCILWLFEAWSRLRRRCSRRPHETQRPCFDIRCKISQTRPTSLRSSLQ